MNISGDDVPIIFTRDGNLFSVRLDGAAPVPLTNNGYDSRPYYLPQESKLLFIRIKSAHDITGDVMSIDFSTGRQTILLPASVLGGLPGTGFVWAALSPGESKLIVTEGNEAFGGFLLHSASTDGKNLSSSITGEIPAEECAFNPDGSGVAFENKHTDVRATLIYNLVWNKSPVPLITSVDSDDNALWAEDYAWRPDGRSITFFGYTFNNGAEGPKNGIYEVTTSGSVTQLYPTPGKWIYDLHWLSADRLAFIAMPAGKHQGRDPGTADFYVFDAPTGKLSLLMSLNYEVGRPQWSWNPNRTAFVFQKEWRGSLWVKDLSTGAEKEIAGTKGTEVYGFTWGSDPFSSHH
jgi:Tol biopolymer transport system component